MPRQDSSKKQAVVDIAKALRDVFKGYTRHARGDAWKKILEPDTKREIEKLVQDPYRPLNMFQRITFKEWIDQEEDFNPEDFFGKIQRYIFANMRVEQGRINFHFPTDYQSFIVQSISMQRPQDITQQKPQMALDAHTKHDGSMISEDEQVQKLLPYAGLGTSKWSGASKALKQVGAPDWKQSQWNAFERIIKSKVRKIARLMGFLFEIEIYLCLEHQHGVKNRDDEEMGQANNGTQIDENRDKFMTQIKENLGSEKQADQIFLMIQSHAKDIADRIFVRSKQLLKCTPDHMLFTGGEGDWSSTGGRQTPSDLVLMCSGAIDGEQGELGWNIKLTSEGRVVMADLQSAKAYKLLGGANVRKFTDELSAIMADSNDATAATDYRQAIIPMLAKVAEDKLTNNPRKFTEILSWLIAGKKGESHPVALAVRHYASSASGGADWSPSLRRDFNIRGLSISPKDEASVSVTSNSTYVKLTYKVSGGSSAGTSIIFEPKRDSVSVKVSNLTREKQ